MIRAFSGLRPVPVDGLPILSAVPEVEGFFLANLHLGLTLAPLVGELMAACVTGPPMPVDIGPYSRTRFATIGMAPGDVSRRDGRWNADDPALRGSAWRQPSRLDDTGAKPEGQGAATGEARHDGCGWTTRGEGR